MQRARISTCMAIMKRQMCQKCHIMSRLSYQNYQILSPPYSDLQVTTRFHLQGTQNLRPIFTEQAQAAVVRHVSGCAHVHSDLEVTTEFHLLGRP